ncbi:MAG: hypothetical protein CMM01_18720 [Rhodopirellula sp.]|nr:hypothetical protein [Rhodopirellula sp.]OUX49896.1 MAG: hypothetical protein CBE43_08655 [Rhodopirellula sp. TMED283]
MVIPRGATGATPPGQGQPIFFALADHSGEMLKAHLLPTGFPGDRLPRIRIFRPLTMPYRSPKIARSAAMGAPDPAGTERWQVQNLP